MIQLEFPLRIGTFGKTSLPIAQLSMLIVSPEEKRSIFEGREAVPPTTLQFMHVEGHQALLTLVKEFADIVDKRPPSHMACSVDAQLTLQIISTSED